MVKIASGSGSGEYSVSDMSIVEEETLKRVGKTMKTLEDFFSRWDASKEKPGEMAPQVAKMRGFHKALDGWQRKAAAGKKRNSSEERLKRLEEFIIICESYY